jgi:1,4-dihydroxy-2-naphthoyl-CoA hydrolase
VRSVNLNVMPEPEAFTQLIQRLAPFTRELGLVATHVEPDRVEATTEWRPERCTAGGVLHGGFLMSVADSVGAMCATLNLPEGAETSTIESKTNFLRSCTGGTITGVAIPLHVGRRTIVVQTDIARDDGKILSRTIQTQAVLDD